MKRFVYLLVMGVVSPSVAWAAQDRTLMLVNSSQQQVTTFKVTPVDGSAAALDVLTGQSLNANANLKVTIPSVTDECGFDLEIGFADGNVEKREAVDFCNTDGYIIEK
jgi:hypothetical protein